MRSGADSEDSAFFLSREKFDEMISDRLIDYMNQHVEESVSVDDICSGLHYNKSYIFRRFKQTTGSSIMAYFTKLKIDRAKILLRESDLSVASISDKLSFDNPNYFSKTFKKITGYTPSTYRKIRRQAK
jgi:YesN/AraC family two-component response regulator